MTKQQEFEERQRQLLDKMKQVSDRMKAIDKKTGNEIAAYIATISLNAVGVPVKIPKNLGLYALLGVLSLPITIPKQRKLKPLYSELEMLTAQYNENAKVYNELVQKGLIEGVEKTPTGGKRSAINPFNPVTETDYLLLAGLGFVGIYILLKIGNR